MRSSDGLVNVAWVVLHCNRRMGAREHRQLIPRVRFQVPFLGPESQLKSGFACAGLLCSESYRGVGAKKILSRLRRLTGDQDSSYDLVVVRVLFLSVQFAAWFHSSWVDLVLKIPKDFSKCAITVNPSTRYTPTEW